MAIFTMTNPAHQPLLEYYFVVVILPELRDRYRHYRGPLELEGFVFRTLLQMGLEEQAVVLWWDAALTAYAFHGGADTVSAPAIVAWVLEQMGPEYVAQREDPNV